MKHFVENGVRFIVFIAVISLLNYGYFALWGNPLSQFIHSYVELRFLLLLICVASGIIFGVLNYLLIERQKKGKWYLDYSKLLCWGVPLLLLILWDPLYWLFGFIPFQPFYNYGNQPTIFIVLSFCFGNIIMHSFYKKQSE